MTGTEAVDRLGLRQPAAAFVLAACCGTPGVGCVNGSVHRRSVGQQASWCELSQRNGARHRFLFLQQLQDTGGQGLASHGSEARSPRSVGQSSRLCFSITILRLHVQRRLILRLIGTGDALCRSDSLWLSLDLRVTA